MKKRVISLLLALVLAVSLLPATVRAAETETDKLSVTQAAAPEAADGTLRGDISVGTAADLAALRQERGEGRALRRDRSIERILYALLSIGGILGLGGIRPMARIGRRACDSTTAVTAKVRTLFDFGTAVRAKHRFPHLIRIDRLIAT